MVGWHYQLDGHEFEQAPGIGDGQGGLVCCSPWGLKESDTTEATQQQQQQLTSVRDYWKNHSFDYMDLCWQSDCSAF